MRLLTNLMIGLVVFAFSCTTVHAQKTDKKLTQEIQGLLDQFKGTAGIYVHNLKNNSTVSINADTIFPTASMIKIPILVGIMNQLEKGQLKYNQELVYKDSLLYAGVDILGSFKPNEKIELGKLMMLMLTMSDNTASLWLQSLAGGGAEINAMMGSLSLKHTRVNSRTAGREGARAEFGWGQTTPFEMANLMEKLTRGEVVSKSSSERMIRLLGRNYWDEHAIASIPVDVFIASKGGAVDATRNEVLFVNGKNCRYLFCICTKNNMDTSWNSENEAWQLTAKISKLIWDRYN